MGWLQSSDVTVARSEAGQGVAGLALLQSRSIASMTRLKSASGKTAQVESQVIYIQVASHQHSDLRLLAAKSQRLESTSLDSRWKMWIWANTITHTNPQLIKQDWQIFWKSSQNTDFLSPKKRRDLKALILVLGSCDELVLIILYSVAHNAAGDLWVFWEQVCCISNLHTRETCMFMF